MRTIKFRAKLTVSGELHYFSLTDIRQQEDGVLLHLAGGYVVVIHTIQEFTGLLDKNRKEIYEGDIFMDEEDGSYNFIEWNDDFGGWGTNQWFLPRDLVKEAPFYEVIGNIYENPELLSPPSDA